jgi:hypothetical protein
VTVGRSGRKVKPIAKNRINLPLVIPALISSGSSAIRRCDERGMPGPAMDLRGAGGGALAPPAG